MTLTLVMGISLVYNTLIRIAHPFDCNAAVTPRGMPIGQSGM